MDNNMQEAVGATVRRLQDEVLGRRGERAQARARGVLAQLRRGVGRPIESDPLGLSRVLLTLDPPLDRGLLGRSDAATPGETAAYHALTLFAWHMQSAREPMHVPGRSFATACGTLYRHTDSDSFKPRFDAMVLAGSTHSRLQLLRSLVALLRGKGLGFDYGQLAADLRALDNPRVRQRVLMRWGRDFARIPPETTDHNS
ncbi:type I-E CRISPR-associated protein Cse2/CasB [Corynebacterium sp. zg-331]|uniref:type I-E CRISPR-associated protein Cse2/CasB n=1 Tax=unclassified Corynebacterium TaxID=2624378 RepID=UPI00128BA62C|nr:MULTISPECIES: type I-E CRISPR-associated protein Cse2/CasB [unclassified Corynebacterium]MBC3186609.1 type I-E CRISPR-associated protein Cse2/CasB [Corynebacterium sp. zg-331]MPV53093.1 type I-E CRISPR-associated protein Cse2/CasB [Corynebacterium sp. zg331]